MIASTLPPPILIHLVAALGALVLGPLALLARKGSRTHRAIGYAWVATMLAAAVSSLFIRGSDLPNIAGFSPIHLLTLVTLVGVPAALFAAARGRIVWHRRAMVANYVGGCVVAGAFALVPDRFLGRMLWQQVIAAL